MNRTVRKSKKPSGKKIYSLPDHVVSGNFIKVKTCFAGPCSMAFRQTNGVLLIMLRCVNIFFSCIQCSMHYAISITRDVMTII